MFKNDLFISSSVFLGIFRAACNKKIDKKRSLNADFLSVRATAVEYCRKIPRGRLLGSSSPCSCWRQMRPCPPWAEARSWPDEMGESAVASHHPGSQTASSHMSFAPPWLPVLPPRPQKDHPAHAWSYWSSCGNTFAHHGRDSGGHRSSTGSSRPSSDTLDKLLHGQRHQAAPVLWFHHVPAQVWIPLGSNLVRTLQLPQDSGRRIPDLSHAAINQPGDGASFCGQTHSMILSWGLNGLRESRPSLLITCTRMNITPLSLSIF